MLVRRFFTSPVSQPKIFLLSWEDCVMKQKGKHLAIFEGKQIRRLWDEKSEKWFFSVVDIVGVLSGSLDPRNYWKVLKNRLTE